MRLDQRTLRAIGQDLETIGLFDFDLELEGERCVVRGMVVLELTRPRGLKALWKEFWRPEPGPVERVYLSDDIDRLVAEGQSRRRDSQAGPKRHDRPELYSTREILRVFSVYCETAGLQLVSVSKRGSRLKYEYLTKSGVRQVESRAFLDLYNLASGMSLERSEREVRKG